MRRDVIRTRKRREKDLLQSQSEDSFSGNSSLDLSSIELSSIPTSITNESNGVAHNGVHNGVKLEPELDLAPTSSALPSPALSSPSTSSNESCNSYNYSEQQSSEWTPHPHDVNPLTYIFSESMDYYNPEHTGIS